MQPPARNLPNPGTSIALHQQRVWGAAPNVTHLSQPDQRDLLQYLAGTDASNDEGNQLTCCLNLVDVLDMVPPQSKFDGQDEP